MTCRELVDLIADALEGELLLPSRRLFESHLRDCHRCRQYLGGYARTVQLLRHAFDEDNVAPSDSIPEELVQAILAGGRRRPFHSATRRPRRPSPRHRRRRDD